MAKRTFPWLTNFDIAHRGLYKAGTTLEENTIAAVSAAVEKGLAVEIDVRTTADDIVVVFHDDTLDRLTEKTGPVTQWGFQQLKPYNVGQSGTPIPSLPDVMDVVAGKVPIFIEIKSPGPGKDIQKVCAGVRHCFEGYAGPVAVMSFDPRITAWFKGYMPKYARGVVIGREVLLHWHTRALIPFWLRKAKPDFIACDINLLPNSFCNGWRKKGKPLLTWTVKEKHMVEIARKHADAIIFEQPALEFDQPAETPTKTPIDIKQSDTSVKPSEKEQKIEEPKGARGIGTQG